MKRLPAVRLTLQVVFTVFAVFCGGLASAAEKPAITQPNIVLILADDLGYGDVRCYNEQSKVPTPNIDRLAREGMRFTDAHSPCTVCTPTRYSLMTGQMAFRVPNGGTVFTGVGGPSLIAPGRLTLPSMLRDNGYATACVGKWHVGLTFFDKEGQPVRGDGVEAMRRVASRAGRLIMASSVSSGRHAVPQRTGSTLSLRTIESPCRQQDCSTSRVCRSIPTRTIAAPG